MATTYGCSNIHMRCIRNVTSHGSQNFMSNSNYKLQAFHFEANQFENNAHSYHYPPCHDAHAEGLSQDSLQYRRYNHLKGFQIRKTALLDCPHHLQLKARKASLSA